MILKAEIKGLQLTSGSERTITFGSGTRIILHKRVDPERGGL